jgi:uncharacterized membrane protein YobD (UPF0266 family)
MTIYDQGGIKVMSLFYDNFFTSYPIHIKNFSSDNDLLNIDLDKLKILIYENSKKIDEELKNLNKLSKQIRL